MDKKGWGFLIMLAITLHDCESLENCDGSSLQLIDSAAGCHGVSLLLKDSSYSRSLLQAKLPRVERNLLSAARDGDIKKAQEALDSGATGNVPTPTQYFTPLIFAARGGHNNIVQLLLDAGVKPDWQTKSGISALWIAAYQGHKNIVLSLLLLGRAKVDLADSNGRTPLYVASQQKHVDVVEILLEKGANTEAVTESGDSPLLAAAQSGDSIVVEVLVTGGANVNAQNRESNKSALWTASFFRHTDVVSVLIEKGAELNLASKDGSTPLFAAAQQGLDIIVSQLLDAGAEVDSQRSDGLTPLHIAAAFEHVKVVKLLVRGGANTKIKNAQGLTAEDLIKDKDTNAAQEIREILLSPPQDVPIEAIEPAPLQSSSGDDSEALASSTVPVPAGTVKESPGTKAVESAPAVQKQLRDEGKSPVETPATVVGAQKEKNSRKKAKKSKMAMIIPGVMVGGLLLLAAMVLLAKHCRKPIPETERIVTKILEDSEYSFQVHNGLGTLGDTHGSCQLNHSRASSAGGSMGSRSRDTNIGRTQHRCAMETRRSHILMDGPSSLQEDARNAEGDILKTDSDYNAVKTWTWTSDDGPLEGGGEIVASYKGSGIASPSGGMGYDSTYLHEQLRLDHQISKMERFPWLTPSTYQNDDSMYGENMWPIARHVRYPMDIRDSARRNPKVVPATFASAEYGEMTDSEMNTTGPGDSMQMSITYDDSAVGRNSQDFGDREILGRHTRRSKSAELCYYVGTGRTERISGSTVKMTADEGSGARIPGVKGGRSRRVIRILYKA